ncbi:cytochrome c maturation protein CcmE [Euzebya tangerina]|uniref:cytochrome c maturation protein CcmE n=1 Tax=Euzebya tangerina TaxID=591198 RepID=UPI000E31F731|nr:cytochrome c maturation protein CcmE [Euzebya tangerina]
MKSATLLLSLGGVAAVLTGFLVFGGLGDNLTYYLTPTEAVDQRDDFADGRRFRLAGDVQPGSVVEAEDGLEFVVADGGEAVRVLHDGLPPQLFSEGIEVVVEGLWEDDVFMSYTMLVKHDEEYYPPSEEASP